MLYESPSIADAIFCTLSKLILKQEWEILYYLVKYVGI